jgi:hypothetical protein
MRNLLAAGAALALFAGFAHADDTAVAGAKAANTTVAEAKAAKQAADTEVAMAFLQDASDYLASRDRFQFTVEQSFDVLQANGMMLEFGGERTVTVRRPDRLRTHVESRDGDQRTFTWDGKQVLLAFPEDDAYATEAFEGDLDGLIDFLVEKLDTQIPLSALLRADFYALVASQVESGLPVGASQIAGQPCIHLAFQAKEVDFQVWIDEGSRPLLRQVVITYKKEEGNPQYRARFLDWDGDPAVGEDRFATTPAVGANRLTIRVPIAKTEQGGEG